MLKVKKDIGYHIKSNTIFSIIHRDNLVGLRENLLNPAETLSGG